LASGKLADLVVLEGDPTADISNSRKIYAVWHRGKKAGGSIETFMH
jgi:imidazolonepropionase-like amidohydrolase